MEKDHDINLIDFDNDEQLSENIEQIKNESHEINSNSDPQNETEPLASVSSMNVEPINSHDTENTSTFHDIEHLKTNIKKVTSNILIRLSEIDKKFHYNNETMINNEKSQITSTTIDSNQTTEIDSDQSLKRDQTDFNPLSENKQLTEIQNLIQEIQSNTLTLGHKVDDTENKLKANIDQNNVYRDSKKNLNSDQEIDKRTQESVECNDKNLSIDIKNIENQLSVEKDEMDPFKSSYSPEEFFQVIKLKNITENSTSPTSPPIIIPSTSTNLSSLPQTSDALINNPQSVKNSFSYSNPQDFIKAVMTKNVGGFSPANAKIFEDFYKDKLKSVPPLNNFSSQHNKGSIGGGNNSSSSFKSAIDALPKVYSNNPTFSSSKNLPQQQQQRGIGGDGINRVYPRANFSSGGIQNRNRDIKVKINKVKEKFAKLAMKNCGGGDEYKKNSPSISNDSNSPPPISNYQNFQVHPMKYQSNKINCANFAANNGKFYVNVNETLVRNEIQTRYFDNKQYQKRSSSRSISESESSVISVISSTKSMLGAQRQQQKSTNESDSKMLPQRCMQSAQSVDSLNTSADTSKSRKRRQRGKRGDGQKNSESQDNDNTEHNVKVLKTTYPRLNAETLIILDLLSLPAEQREKYLFDLAKERQILVVGKEIDAPYELHPKLQRYKAVLRLGKQSGVNDEENKRIRVVLDQITNQLQPPQGKKEKTVKYFEDHVNAIVHEGMSSDKIDEFTFPTTSKRQRYMNYFQSHDFIQNLEEFAQKCCAAGLGYIIEGEIRINGKNNEQAFVKHIDGGRDAMFQPQLVRKFALHGDIVRAFVRKPQPQPQTQAQSTQDTPSENANKTGNNDDCVDGTIAAVIPSNSSSVPVDTVPIEEGVGLASLVADENIEGDECDEIDIKLQCGKSCKGFVIKILEKIHNRKCVGNFLSYRSNSEFITFIPRDMKLPVMRIYKEHWPEKFQKNQLENITDTLYAAEIIEWKNDQCIGKILQAIGKCDELDSENKAILYQNNLNMEKYDEKFNALFYGPLMIDDNEIAKRKDLRRECIFTIDPLTARDLDDALSCKKLSDNNYEIGVHISDVSYFLHENTELDKIVSERTTSVYMVNEVFHMLPKSLCFKCSLLPGEDKFTFSIFWIMNDFGQVIDFYIKRTIVNSCTQFAYEHAQLIIDNPEREFTENDFPQIHNGFTVNDIVERVKIMHKIATILRKKRFDNGALRINRPKLSFELHPDTGEPIDYSVYELRTANYMIEEFMLLANQYVAKFIHEHFPKISILRNHEPPIKNVILTLQERLAKLGLNFNATSSRTIYESMNHLIGNSKHPEAMEICLAHLVSKPMTRARYFCSEKASNKEDFWHYALSIPIYTHFTSPIRRYPDVLVHRVLSAALGYTPPPTRKPEDLHLIAAICNEMKYNAKIAGEDSSNLYFKHFIKSKKSVIFRAAILEIFSYSMEVILIETGHIIRIDFSRDGKKKGYKVTVNTSKLPYTAVLTCNPQNNKTNKKNNATNDTNAENTNHFPPIEMKMFSEVSIEVQIGENKKLLGSIAIPSEMKNDQQSNDDEKRNIDAELNLLIQNRIMPEEQQELENESGEQDEDEESDQSNDDDKNDDGK